MATLTKTKGNGLAPHYVPRAMYHAYLNWRAKGTAPHLTTVTGWAMQLHRTPGANAAAWALWVMLATPTMGGKAARQWARRMRYPHSGTLG